MNPTKEIKKQLRVLRKQIKDLKAEKSRAESREDRRNLRNKIKELKAEMVELKTKRIEKEKEYNNPKKEKLIAEILVLEPNFPQDLVNLNKFTIEQLEKHIECVKRKRGKNEI